MQPPPSNGVAKHARQRALRTHVAVSCAGCAATHHCVGVLQLAKREELIAATKATNERCTYYHLCWNNLSHWSLFRRIELELASRMAVHWWLHRGACNSYWWVQRLSCCGGAQHFGMRGCCYTTSLHSGVHSQLLQKLPALTEQSMRNK